MFLILKDLIHSEPKGFVGSTLINMTIRDYGVQLNFMPRLSLEISEYWELHNEKDETIDRAVQSENRKEFFLFKLIGKKVILTEKQMDTFFIHFDNGFKFLIYFDPRAQKDPREEERRKVFGTNKNSWDIS